MESQSKNSFRNWKFRRPLLIEPMNGVTSKKPDEAIML